LARVYLPGKFSNKQEKFMSTNALPTGPESQIPVTMAQGKPEDVVVDCNINELYYGNFKAVRDTQIPIKKNSITAFIGPSGCGKSTVLRCLNRMNDLVRGFRFLGHVSYRGRNIYDRAIDPVAVRRFIGMVFQQPNPFATSIFNNVAFGLRLNGYKGNKTEKVEKALRGAALWDEVKDKLNKSGLSLSGGQQQRLCIARASTQVHHRHRDPQPPAGAARGRLHGLYVCGHHTGRAHRIPR
jgi:ABC-type ATPase involved in cell division